MTTIRPLFLSTLFVLAAFSWSSSAGVAVAEVDVSKFRPMKGISYSPAPSDDGQMHGGAYNEVYFDTDFYNEDFAGLWGLDGSSMTGRNDLDTLKAAGINFLHIYNWNPGRNHDRFLQTAHKKGIKVIIPISNYTYCLIVGGCQGVGQGSYMNAYNNVKAIFKNIYPGSQKTPIDGAAMWGIFNEFDVSEGFNIKPQYVVFIIQAIIKLEDEAGIAPKDRLPIAVPVSTALLTAANFKALGRPQPDYYKKAELDYLDENSGSKESDIPMGVLSLKALGAALKKTSEEGTVNYPDSVTVAAIPADFWTNRFVAAVNPFQTPQTTYDYIVNPKKFPSAFPGTNNWNALPPMFFGELGINVGGAGGSKDKQATWVLGQLKCTNPLAADASKTPKGYFIGSNVFEFEFEGTNGDWGMFVAGSPSESHKTTTGKKYLVDTLQPQPVWSSVKPGYETTALPSNCQ